LTRRIAHVISSPEGLGGAEQVLLDLVEGARDRGWEQLVLQPFARAGGAELRAALGDVEHVALPATGVADLALLRSRLSSRLRAFAPHVVHVHLFHAGVAVAALRLPGVRTVWSHHHGSFMRDQGRRTSALLDRWALRRYDVVVAVSESVRAFLTEDCRLAPERVRVVRNGWQGRPRPKDTAPRPPTVVSVGMFRPEKDQATLVRAIAAVRSRGVPARLVLVGDGPLRASLEELARQLGLAADAVKFAGRVSDIWPLLAAADVFALSSVHETLGIAVIEAMAAGLPTVATDVGGLPELVEPDVTGHLVPPRDPAALAEALSALLTNAPARDRMARAARERAEGLRAADMVATYYDIYDAKPHAVHEGR
jgi:glycosyltransferase involved in cell wall biosynthesis